MKILKLLNKKILSIFFFSLIIFSTNLRSEEEPVDIWNLEKKVEENNKIKMVKIDKYFLFNNFKIFIWNYFFNFFNR